MSFFRNFRAKTRSKSTSRYTTPVNTNSRPGSVISNTTLHTLGSYSARRESVDSRTDSLLNRSDTFILNSDQEDKESKQNSSNNSTLEKKSKKSKVLSKFATFTKRKKTPTPEKADSLEHHPSDNATNTYYKWKADGPTSAHTLDYDSQSDPFNFLYEQHSSLKGMQQGSSSGSMHSTQSSNSSTHNQPFDSSTYRKGKIPTQLKEQLSQLKTQTKPDLHEDEEFTAEQESAADKYKTVTLNSFRKSFREKFLLNQHNPPHNPAWFVEVEPPKSETLGPCESKENRPDFLVFENENYRPNSRSPVRDSKERTPRSTSRSPVKRNETFRMERPTFDATKSSQERHKGIPKPEVPSIRIEIKNSIAPNMPSRIVPVGVAKPMLSPHNMQENYQNSTARSNAAVTTNAVQPIKQNKVGGRDKSPHNWGKPITVTPVRYPTAAKIGTTIAGRYQTLVQIRNEANAKAAPTQTQQRSPVSRSRLSTRIQLGGAGGSPTLQKRLNTPGTRHSLATPLQTGTLSSYELLKNTPELSTKSAMDQRMLSQPKHTYFGDAALHTANSNNSKNISTTTFSMGRTPVHSTIGGFAGTSSYATSTSRLQQPQALRATGGGINCRTQQQQQQQHQQQRVLVPTQRRSRSPIKIPWR
ncbi:uncharacterized protein [Bactrocera oleae]|uniref:uncharacterized protein n=1 Tax=Bactrocera oleae TaxID=104688 RepID=UPI00387E95FC